MVHAFQLVLELYDAHILFLHETCNPVFIHALFFFEKTEFYK